MKNVLIISDDNETIEKLQVSLVSDDFIIHTLPDRDDIVPELVNLQPDLVLIDFLLNSVNGGTLCHQIRSSEDTQYMPIVILSDYPNIEQYTAKFGCNAIIRKPVKKHELVDTLTVLLSKKGMNLNHKQAS